jgi:hypothetical protein
LFPENQLAVDPYLLKRTHSAILFFFGVPVKQMQTLHAGKKEQAVSDFAR